MFLKTKQNPVCFFFLNTVKPEVIIFSFALTFRSLESNMLPTFNNYSGSDGLQLAALFILPQWIASFGCFNYFFYTMSPIFCQAVSKYLWKMKYN
jgi:hypothetical protein